jgi:hypothetical protein
MFCTVVKRPTNVKVHEGLRKVSWREKHVPKTARPWSNREAHEGFPWNLLWRFFTTQIKLPNGNSAKGSKLICVPSERVTEKSSNWENVMACARFYLCPWRFYLFSIQRLGIFLIDLQQSCLILQAAYIFSLTRLAQNGYSWISYRAVNALHSLGYHRHRPEGSPRPIGLGPWVPYRTASGKLFTGPRLRRRQQGELTKASKYFNKWFCLFRVPNLGDAEIISSFVWVGAGLCL